MAVVGTQGATGHILEVFEVRNTGPTACSIYGYFGVALTDANHHLYVIATRATEGWFGKSVGPHTILLPADSPPIGQSAALPPEDGVAGHAFFDLEYADACDGGRPTGGDRWQLIPPDEREPTFILEAGSPSVNCGLIVRPVEERPFPTV